MRKKNNNLKILTICFPKIRKDLNIIKFLIRTKDLQIEFNS